jgi:hypothetical protein
MKRLSIKMICARVQPVSISILTIKLKVRKQQSPGIHKQAMKGGFIQAKTNKQRMLEITIALSK